MKCDNIQSLILPIEHIDLGGENLAKKASIFVALATLASGITLGIPYASTAFASTNTFTTINEDHPITAGAPMNPFNASPNTFLGYDQMQLAWFTNSATNENSFLPGLAKSWAQNKSGTSVIVTLQPGAKWSNGTPVTANDVITSMAIAFTQGNAQAFFLGSVKALSKNEIQFNQVAGQHYNLFMNELLQSTIVPASVYGSQLPSNIWTLIEQSQYSGSNKAKAAVAAKAETQLTNLGKKIVSFAPTTDVSAGPFVIKNLNPGEAYLTKNPYFYAANKVQVDNVVFRNYTGNQQIWNYLISGQLDQAPFTAMPSNILQQVLRVKTNKEVSTPSFVGAALAFNQSVYPYNLTAVRQALAHVIDRSAVQKVAEPVSGSISQYSDGMVDAATNDWLSKSQVKSLNSYSSNLSLATTELESAGFKKVNGQWMMPNGKPWTATIYTVNGFSDWIEASKVIASEMTSFGIPAQPSIVNSYAEYLQEIALGKYPIGFWLNALGPSAYGTFQRIYGTPDGYNVVGGKLQYSSASVKSKGNWLDIPTTIKLPDGKTVNPGQLTYELNDLSSAQQKPIVAELAEATNVNMPMITLWNYINVQFVNSSRFTDFPTNSGILDNPAGVWMALGYVKPSK